MNELLEYHKMRPEQYLKRLSEMPVAYIALGTLEWHGLHNPLGLDGVKAEGIVAYLAGKLGGIVMPPLYWGDNRHEIGEVLFDYNTYPWMFQGEDVPSEWKTDHTLRICKEMNIDKEAFEKDSQRSIDKGGWRIWEELLVHMFFEIETLGFKLIIPYAGHGSFYVPVDRAICKYHDEGGTCKVFAIHEDIKELSDMYGPVDHAASYETSLIMALFPELVDLNKLNSDLTKQDTGIFGKDPRIFASREHGLEVLQKMVEVAAKYINKYI